MIQELPMIDKKAENLGASANDICWELVNDVIAFETQIDISMPGN